MNEQARAIRLRRFFDQYALGLVVAAVVIGLAGGYLAFTAYGATTTTTEVQTVAEWESSGTFTHQATVVNDTAVYDEGDVLRDRETYFRSLTPHLNGSFLYTYAASEGGNLTATATTVLVYRSAESTDEGAGTTYWQLNSTLQERRVTGLGPGERLRVPFSVNVTDAAGRLETIDQQFGTTPGEKEFRVEARLTLSGTRNGRPVDRTQTYRLPVSVSNSVYTVSGDGPTTASGEQTERTEVSVPAGPLAAYGGPLLALLGFGVAGGLVAARRRGDFGISEAEREWLAYRDARAEFEDWITVARISEGKRRGVDIEIDSLAGLVDIAIDSDRRVLEDERTGLLLVFEDDRTYAYDPPADSLGRPTEDGTTGTTATALDEALQVTAGDTRASDGNGTDDTDE